MKNFKSITATYLAHKEMLVGGQAGLWYTEDGQHGNPAGVKLWFDCLKKVILNKTIMIE